MGHLLLRRGDVVGTLELDGLEFILQLVEGVLSIFLAPEVQREILVVPFRVVLVEEAAEGLEDEVSLVPLFEFKGDCELEGEVRLLDLAG